VSGSSARFLRTVCPACNTRRMAEAAAHLVDPGPLRGAPALPHRYRRPAPEGRGLPAVLLWGLAARDRRIGWSEAQRKAHLQRVVDNSRFLLLPWVRIRHLVSHVLARGAWALEADWEARFRLRPWLLETLVDPVRFSGTCYRAVN